ncbi:AMP-binding protein [Aliihoeflea aestuarii]|jgi:feruloyl-CoA synthase|uniref:feruloyl-CoA synthase n=1 Tax=Aliihoeflea aestuarii TaxID=453840 RepID=UPI0020944CD0|nr:feruloyl-CoA synthase [Aliihoeflea aestuarii]MCO6392915.1 AMP-binding protein [Aliihoeflea aestuarii]
MPILSMPGMRPVNMGELAADIMRESDVIRVKARAPLDSYPRSLIDRLRYWSEIAPDRVFLADRGQDGEWRRLTYADALDKARSIGEALLARNLSVERPVVILSGNSIEHGLMALGAMMAGIAYAPVSPAYSLVSSDFAKLKHIFSLLTPGLVLTAYGAPFADALDAVLTDDMELVVGRNAPAGRKTTPFDDLLAVEPDRAVDAAEKTLSGDTVAKFLFTSGSTGMPKAVINTHRMMACNQVMIATALAFLKDKPPVMVDWLPWNHTAGGNHNFGIALHNGGTLYIDDGNPTPAGIERTVRNLEEVAPTLYFNVPKGFEMLADHLARNEKLRRTFFSKVELLQYAGAGLAQHVWDALERLAIETVGEKIMIVTGYGSTETAPFASTTTWPVTRPGEVGLPAPGLELKLVPNAEKLELRLKGPSITPGYWRQPDKTAECFDEDGFYRIGDALKFVDPDDVDKGFLFDGRVSEDFKLSTGTWVNMAGVRGSVISACAPLVRDVVLTGLDRNHIGALLVLDFDAARKADPDLAKANEETIARHPCVRVEIQKCLDMLAAKSTGSSNLVARAIILDAPPSIDRHEVTDKGSINQRAVMAARADQVDHLYAEPSPTHVIVADGKAAL